MPDVSVDNGQSDTQTGTEVTVSGNGTQQPAGSDALQTGPVNGEAKQQGGQVGNTAAARDVLGSTSVVGGKAVVFIDNRAGTVYGYPLQRKNTAVPSANTAAGQNVQGTAKDAFPAGDVSGNVEPAASVEEGQTDVSGNATASNDDAATAQKGGGFPKYTIAGDKIAGQAYYKDDTLLQYDFPEGITQMGDFAFARSSLQEIAIPEGETKIG